MGYEANVYVGVYIKVPRVFTTETSPSKWHCKGDKSHRVQPSYKFCPICGSDIVVVTKDLTIAKEVRPYDLETDDWYCPESCLNIDGYSIWLPNMCDDPSQVRFDEMVKITPEMIAVVTASFKSKHRDIMVKLATIVDGVEAEFGAVKYWS